MLARRLELFVEALQLVVHPVDVDRERAQLVAVGDVHMPREVPGSNRSEPEVDPLDRPDHRPREDEPEQQRKDDRSRRHADEEVARVFVRACVLGDEGVGPRRRGIRELGGELVEVDGEQLGLDAERRRLSTPCGRPG